jgi:hypothetical protein
MEAMSMLRKWLMTCCLSGTMFLAGAPVVQALSINWLILPRVHLKEVSVKEAIQSLQKQCEAAHRGDSINVVFDLPRLGEEALTRKITYSNEKVPCGEAIRDVAERAGLAVRVEPYAMVITTRSAAGVTEPVREKNREQASRFTPRPLMVFFLKVKET